MAYGVEEAEPVAVAPVSVERVILAAMIQVALDEMKPRERQRYLGRLCETIQGWAEPKVVPLRPYPSPRTRQAAGEAKRWLEWASLRFLNN